MPPEIPNLNFATARFECTFGRGCDGICCRKGRPPLYADDIARIDAKLPAILPMLRPRARKAAETRGYVSGAKKRGQPVARVVEGWCIFFNQGCVLHKLGAAEGDKLRYKPVVCALFPLDRDRHDRWYVRQRGFEGEIWDLFCLDPTPGTPPASESLRDEMAVACRITEAEAAAAKTDPPPSAVSSTKTPSGNRPRSACSADTAS
jgi:hypothetical protein